MSHWKVYAVTSRVPAHPLQPLRREGQQGVAHHLQDLVGLPVPALDTGILVLTERLCASSWLEPL